MTMGVFVDWLANGKVGAVLRTLVELTTGLTHWVDSKVSCCGFCINGYLGYTFNFC